MSITGRQLWATGAANEVTPDDLDDGRDLDIENLDGDEDDQEEEEEDQADNDVIESEIG